MVKMAVVSCWQLYFSVRKGWLDRNETEICIS